MTLLCKIFIRTKNILIHTKILLSTLVGFTATDHYPDICNSPLGHRTQVARYTLLRL